MPTYLDESGHAGVTAKAAPYFRLAAVWFETAERAEACRTAIAHLRQHTLRLERTFEFKSAKTPVKYLRVFLETVAEHPFRFVVSSLDKRAADAAEWKTKEDIHSAAIGAIRAALLPVYVEAEKHKGAALGEHVVADRTDDAVYFRVLRNLFFEMRSVERPGASLVKSVKPGNSHANELLQLADIVCGVVGWHLNGESSLYKTIAAKKLDVIALPEKAERGRPEPPAF